MAKVDMHTHNLLRAIEGYKGAVAGQKGYEPITSQLERIRQEAERGHSTPQDSPGRREAASAAASAFQRDHPSEEAHAPGEGNTRSNRDAPPAREAETPPDVAGRRGGAAEKISTSPGPAPSQDNLRSAASAPFPHMEAEIRRAAADRELQRPDGKMKSTAERNAPGGNEKSVAKAPAAAPGPRIGNVAEPPITNTQKPGEVAKAGREAQKPMEDIPPYAKEDLSGDGWTRASAKAKAKMAMQKAIR